MNRRAIPIPGEHSYLYRRSQGGPPDPRRVAEVAL